jgi:uroporphyrinogen III methyltransferase / synthase
VAEATPKSLTGKRIVITRAAVQSEAIARELTARGAIPVMLPLVSFGEPEDFAPLDAAIAEIQQFDWMIFTSAQAVRSVVRRCEGLKISLIHGNAKLRIACVGPVTAEAARQAGLAVEYVAQTHTGMGLAEELGSELAGKAVLLPRSDRANPDLPVALKRYGAQVVEVIAYRTLRPTAGDEKNLRQIADGPADAILFFSPSAVHHFGELAGGEQLSSLQDKLAIVAVGPVTANALRDAEVSRALVAAGTSASAVIEALEKHFADVSNPAQAGAKRV